MLAGFWRWVSCGGLVVLPAFLLVAGCKKQITATDFPDQTIKVRYVRAVDYTDCLLASTVMCANYVAGRERLVLSEARTDLEAAGLDRTRVDDVRGWLASEAFRLIPLKGRLARTPPDGLMWWVLDRGYPAICIINKHGGDPEYNHAVVVIGFESDDNGGQVAGIHVLEPAAKKGLETWDRETFEQRWVLTGQVMMLIFEEPEPSAPVDEESEPHGVPVDDLDRPAATAAIERE
jgi:hypothetical protein